MILGPPLPLSGSTNGRPILVITNSGNFTTIHTAAALTTGTQGPVDRVWLWVANPQATTQTIVVSFGGQATSDRLANGYSMTAATNPVLICDGLPLRAGLVVYALSNSASGDVGPIITGYYIRITP